MSFDWKRFCSASSLRSAFPNWDFSWRYNTKNTGQSRFNELSPCDFLWILIKIWPDNPTDQEFLAHGIFLTFPGFVWSFTEVFPGAFSWRNTHGVYLRTGLSWSWSHSGIFAFGFVVFELQTPMCACGAETSRTILTFELFVSNSDWGTLETSFWTSGPQSFWAKCPCVASLAVTSRGRWLLSLCFFKMIFIWCLRLV